MKMFSDNRGQGLLETIIAIGVMVTGLVGAISLVNFTIVSASKSQDRLVASYLASEAVEVVINLRDSNFLAGDAFDTGLTGDGTAIAVFDDSANVWILDFIPNNFSDANTLMYLQGGVYRQDTTTPSGAATKYRRLVTFNTISTDQIDVIVEVQWQDRGNTQSVVIDRSIYNWR